MPTPTPIRSSSPPADVDSALAVVDAVERGLRSLVDLGYALPADWRDTAEDGGRDRIVAVWVGALRGHPPTAILAAFAGYPASVAGRSSGRWPAVGDVLALLEDQAGEGDAVEAYGRLRELVRRHGVDDPPLRPDDASGWTLDADPQIAAWCARAVVSVGWRAVRAGAVDGSAREAWTTALRAAVEASCSRASVMAAEPVGPRREAGLRALDAAERVDAADLWRAVVAGAHAHGDADPPGERPRGWRLDAVPAIEARMHAGLLALGGWRAVCGLPVSDPEYGHRTDAEARRTFAAAYANAAQREARTSMRDVLRLVDRGGASVVPLLDDRWGGA